MTSTLPIDINYTNEQSQGRKIVGTPFLCVPTEKSTARLRLSLRSWLLLGRWVIDYSIVSLTVTVIGLYRRTSFLYSKSYAII